MDFTGKSEAYKHGHADGLVGPTSEVVMENAYGEDYTREYMEGWCGGNERRMNSILETVL